MPDREKVIKAIEEAFDLVHSDFIGTDDFNETEWEQNKADALALLKEQEAVKPKSKVRHGANSQIQHFCGNCNTMLHGKPKFCSECGKGVLW